MINYLPLDDAEASSVLYGMFPTEWPGLAAAMMGVPENTIDAVTVMVIDGSHCLVVTEA